MHLVFDFALTTHFTISNSFVNLRDSFGTLRNSFEINLARHVSSGQVRRSNRTMRA